MTKTSKKYFQKIMLIYVNKGATCLLFLLRLLLKITLVYTYKNHMLRIRRRIMFMLIYDN